MEACPCARGGPPRRGGRISGGISAFFRHEDKFSTDGHRKAWLIRCTINRAKSLLASPWRRRTAPLELLAQAHGEDTYSEVWDAVMSLPQKYRTVIHLYYYEGLSVGEIARALGSPKGTVKSQLARARAMLREALGEEAEL